MNHTRGRSPRLAVATAIVLALAVSLSACSRQAGSTPAEAQSGLSSGFVASELNESNSDFALYVRQQAEQLQGGTTEFAAAFASGDDALARALYAPTRAFYNRILAVSDSFPDLAARIDGREVDSAPGSTLSGWHGIERYLWPAAGAPAPTAAQRQALASALDSDTHDLYALVEGVRPSIAQQATGAATTMSTLGVNAADGSQELYSHTDLSDLQGYVDGARVVFRGMRDLLVTQDAALATTLDHQFDGVQDSLNAQRDGVSFKTFDEVPAADLASLQVKVDALASSLGEVAPVMALQAAGAASS